MFGIATHGQKIDVALLGGGLSCSLIAWFLKRRRPELSVVIFEARSEIARNRTWSFHRSDVGSCFTEIEDLIFKRWPTYQVRFPKFTRTFDSMYCTVTPEHLQMKLEDESINVQFQSDVAEIGENFVRLSSGKLIAAECVIDGRGLNLPAYRQTGFQKFVGLNVRLAYPHGLTSPVLMDATVDQKDGYRFFYLLPWSKTELLVEDTRYSNTSDIDSEDFRTEIMNYCARQGWAVEEILNEEKSALPIPLDHPEIPESAASAVGLAAGILHPVTGYTLPDAVRVADLISRLPSITTSHVRSALKEYRRERRYLSSFYFALNRMMFLAAPQSERRKVFEHFYRLPEPAVQRFYAGLSTIGDRLRILTGKPPVPVWAAAKSIFSTEARS